VPGHTGPLALLVSFDHADASRPAAEQALRDAGFAVAEAPTAEAALAQAEPPDLVLLAPAAGPAAAEFCRRFKGDPAAAVVPVLLLSDDDGERAAALGAGADACLAAAVGPRELAAAVKALFRCRRAGAGAPWRVEEQFRALATHAPVGIFLTDEQGRCLMVNERWCALAGMTPEQARGDGWVQALHPEDRDRVAREWSDAARQSREFSSQYRFVTPHGRVCWLAGSAVALRDEAGRLTGHLGTLTDVTALKHAEEELRRADASSRSVLDNVIDGIVTIDERGVVGSLNPAAERLFGYDAAEVLGRNVSLLMPEPYHSQHDGYLAAYLSTGQAKVIGIGREVVGRRKDGSTFPMELAVSEFRLGQRRYFTGIVRDVSERKRLEGELKRRATELEQADRRKDAFLAMLAHELRGPLAPLTNALHLLRLRSGDPAAVEQAGGLAERQVRQLARLVDDLLDVSRVAQGKLLLVRQRVDAAAVVAQAVETARPLLEARRHELNVLLPPEPPGLEADPARLVQILSNLLGNAARYTPEGGKVWLCVERDGADVLFRVRDTGVGLTPEMLPRVFELFGQVQRGAQGGLGIGLALVRGLAELHGGSVLAYSDGPGEGSEFVVRLPGLPVGPAEAARPSAEEAAGGPPRRVLVVEDNVDAADSLALVLRLRGHEALVAYDGVTALELARLRRPEVILLDVGLPGGLDGHEVARRLRREPALAGVLLVALTGWGQEEDRRRALESGFDRFLVKPVEPRTLERLLGGPEAEPRRQERAQ
jgi:PAS domain S-box-containing protein